MVIHLFANSYVTEFVQTKKKIIGISITEPVLIFIYPSIFNMTFKCSKKADSTEILSQKIDNATDSLMQHISETCKENGKNIDFEKIQIEMQTICKMEVEKNTVQDFVQIMEHFDAHEMYRQCDSERHSVIAQLSNVRNGVVTLNKTLEDLKKSQEMAQARQAERSQDGEFKSQSLLFEGGLEKGYLKGIYVRDRSSTDHVNQCMHAHKFHEYNAWLKKISDASKIKGNRPLLFKSEFDQFTQDLLVFDRVHETHEVFLHLKQRLISDISLINTCNVWVLEERVIELEANPSGFQDVVCKFKKLV